MSHGGLVRTVLVLMATLGICLPEAAFAAAPPPPPAVTDIALADGGVLHGQVVDLQGGRAANLPVSIKAQDREVARAVTTADGRFAVPGLRGGVYQLAAGDGQGIYRVWAPKTAPHTAQSNAIVYTQCPQPRSTLKMLLATPIVIAGVVATAVAVPVALANSGSGSP
jgi:hypothetical protein